MSDLKRKTLGAMLWSILRAGWSSAVILILFIILARILEPEDFGLFALASILVEVARVLASGGLGDAVIRSKTTDDQFVSTVFWLNLGLSAVFAGLIVAIAPLYADYLKTEQTLHVIYALALTLPLNSLGAVHGALLSREFRYSALTLQSMLASVISGTVAVTMAWNGFGIWSLVGQAFTSAVVSGVFAWTVVGWRPRLQFDPSVVRGIAAFGSSLAVTQLVWMLLVRVQDLFIGSVYGAAAVGIYRIAWRLIELIANMLLGPVSSVALVSFSRLQDEPHRMRHAYNRMIGIASIVVFPMLLGFGATAALLVPLIFGDKWGDAVPVTQVLTLMVVPFVFNFFAGSALTAANRAGAVLQVALVQLAATIVFTWIAVPYGIVAVAAAYVLRAYLTMPLQQYMLDRHLGIKMMSTWRAMMIPLGSAVVMAGAVHLSLPALTVSYGYGWPTALMAVGLGAAIYLGLIVALARAQLRDIVTTILSLRSEKKAAS